MPLSIAVPPPGIPSRISVTEQYTLVEKVKITVDTTGTSYTLTTTDAKLITIMAVGDAIRWDIETLGANSPRLPADGSITFTVGELTQPVTLYFVAEATVADVYVLVFR